MKTRHAIANLAVSLVGLNEKDGSFKQIIDIYNSGRGKAPKMDYKKAWCATFISALAIKLGYTDIIPVECSCGRMIELAKKMGIWQEKDSYVPKIADIVMYDWQDSGKGDDTGWPDHTGVVVDISNNRMKVIEGNKSNAVSTRSISVNSKYLRGYITPKYDDMVQHIEPLGADIFYIEVTCQSLTKRNAPNLNGKVLGYAHKGDVLAIFEEKNNWGKIGENAWISLNTKYSKRRNK
jgi:hypothetical protein